MKHFFKLQIPELFSSPGIRKSLREGWALFKELPQSLSPSLQWQLIDDCISPPTPLSARKQPPIPLSARRRAHLFLFPCNPTTSVVFGT